MCLGAAPDHAKIHPMALHFFCAPSRFLVTAAESLSLLSNIESWVLTKEMERWFQSFHNRCARFITGQHIRQNEHGTWTHPPTEEVLREAGMWTIQEYIRQCRETVFRYVKERPIYQECVDSKPLASNINQAVWWNTNPLDGEDNIRDDA